MSANTKLLKSRERLIKKKLDASWLLKKVESLKKPVMKMSQKKLQRILQSKQKRKVIIKMEGLLAAAQESGSQGSTMSTFLWILGAVGLWKMFEKAGTPGWAGLIPFYREYKLCENVMDDPWYWLRTLLVIIPIIGWAFAIYFQFQICKATAKAYGKPDSWAWGYLFLSPVFWAITGFDSSDYYGPFGSGDHRTGEARQARTVDFDVVEPAPAASRAPEAEVYRAEPEVKINQVDDNVVINEVRDVDFDTTKNEDVEFEFTQDGLGE